MPQAKILFRRTRFWFHLGQAYLKRYQIRIATTLIIIFVLAFGIFKVWPIFSKTNTISIGYVGAYTIENIPPQVLSLVTDPLITLDTEGRPTPAIASHWTVSEDGKTYVVYLKDNLSWHDSSQVEATNISIAISNIEINALNNKTLEFKLPNPISSFLQTLNKPVFKANTYYGTGNYRMVKIDQVDSVVKKIVLLPKDHKQPSVEIKFYQNQQQAASALKIGEIKVASIANTKDLLNWPNLIVEKTPDYFQEVTLFFNTQDPDFSSKDLRQALAYSVNQSEFDGIAATSPISPKSWAYNDNAKRYIYNTGKAKELLAKLENKPGKITLSVSSGLSDVAQRIKSDWEALGLAVEVREEESTPQDFQVLLAVNEIAPDPDQYALWHSTQQKTNITKYQNVKVDKLLEDARSIQDEALRKELYFDFQKEVMEDLPAFFLYHPNKYNVTYKNVKKLVDKLPKEE